MKTNACESRWEETAQRHTSLFCWNRGEVPVDHMENNGSCCFLQTRQRRVLVTCAHVWKKFDEFQRQQTDARLWISLLTADQCFAPALPFPVSNPRAFPIDNALDLVTVVFDEIDLMDAWRFCQFSGGGAPVASIGDAIHFLGFAGDGLRAGNPSRELNYFYSSRTVHEVTRYQFLLHDEPAAMHHENKNGGPIPPVRVAGVSGAPAFRVRSDLRLELAGIVSQLSSSGLRGSTEEQYEMGDGDVYVTHACFIQEDGRIEGPHG